MPSPLQLDAIHKRFGETEALKGVSLELRAGEIHALLGENGAGKSTLMKIAFGLLAPDSGRVLLNGVVRTRTDPREARRSGLGMVHQHFSSIPAFTVAENVALAAGWSPAPRRLRDRVGALARETGLELDPDAPAESLSAELRQRLEVLKALASDARVLLLDEPTSVLAPAEAVSFLDLTRRLKAHGIASVLITHKLEEARRVADRVTVLRRGEVVHAGPITETTVAGLTAAMLGTVPPRALPVPPSTPGEVAIAADRLVVEPGDGRGSGLRGGSLEVRSGELVGIAAVEGNGQKELMRALAGLLPIRAGSLRVAEPVALIPEDRGRDGLIAEFTLTENLALTLGRAGPWAARGWIDWQAANRRTAELVREQSITAAGPTALASSLSGGNQQRFMIASLWERHPRVLLAENPARGLDLKATAEVFGHLRAAASGGVAVVVHLPDLDELLELADRIVVLTSGQCHAIPPGTSREAIGALMLGAGAMESHAP